MKVVQFLKRAEIHTYIHFRIFLISLLPTLQKVVTITLICLTVFGKNRIRMKLGFSTGHLSLSGRKKNVDVRYDFMKFWNNFHLFFP